MLMMRIKHDADDEEGCWKQGLNIMLMMKKDAENE